MRKERAVQRYVKKRRGNEECLCKHMTYERRVERMKKNEKKTKHNKLTEMMAEELKTRFQMLVSSICVYIYIVMACGKPMSQLDFEANLRRVRVSVASDKSTVWPAAMKRFGSLLIALSNDIHQEQTHTHTHFLRYHVL